MYLMKDSISGWYVDTCRADARPYIRCRKKQCVRWVVARRNPHLEAICKCLVFKNRIRFNLARKEVQYYGDGDRDSDYARFELSVIENVIHQEEP